jgi:alpha-D-ribose 1-methylphosphonate 5-triphosphate diphosphatase
MTQTLNIDICGADVLRPDGIDQHVVTLSDGMIADAPTGRAVDLSGYLVLPGIIDLHGDGFERHVAPRRGAMTQMREGLIASEIELAANGVTTGYLAQFWSWEGGLRGRDFAGKVLSALAEITDKVPTDMRAQLRFETHQLDDYAELPRKLAEWRVGYMVFNDHLPHDRLTEGRKPPRLTGQALKAGRNPEAHFQMLLDMQARDGEVPAALDEITAVLAAQGVRMGSHDDQTAIQRNNWRARGVSIAEFPETLIAAKAAKAAGDYVVMGAPNLMRGGSHKGNVSALEIVSQGLCDALASDYHYPSLRRGALFLVETGVMGWPQAWGLVSSGPAGVMGLTDRGAIVAGKRADLLILDGKTHRVAATIAGGQVSHMSGQIASRFFG